ncbi:MAG: ferredoxin-type protein NapF [Azoarcus sp.]|uniref:Ferredoxin-type protein NapF n=1 Tax=Aromatoleum tolulyticum TaxID=34027 RepID=A0A1N6ZIW1_9RHOO|nr:ferredoxin-type protein NapF [Aromatoleum tolulyticum]MCK9985710.1 ferredoxin-type protein NapF [Azoarcus sp.]SIR26765.1 ferredoxin-type protein NapF [Aromatoleum tolulyticum]
MSTSRRGFLRGRFRFDPDVQRPPWAIPEGAFEDQCTRCGDCLKACPPAILVAAPGGYPVVDFSRGECSFCGDCVAACKAQALRRADDAAAPWQLKAAIGDTCLAHRGVECRVCGEVCGEAAIRFRPSRGGVAQPLFDAARCTGCGGCQAPCPTGAIAMKNEVEMSV